LSTGSNSEATEYRTESERDAPPVQQKDRPGISGGCFLHPAIYVADPGSTFMKQRFRPMDRRIDQLLDSTERFLRYSSIGQMPTGLTPGSSIAASGNKRFHFNCSQRGTRE
jgi:RES domain-containing protein